MSEETWERLEPWKESPAMIEGVVAPSLYDTQEEYTAHFDQISCLRPYASHSTIIAIVRAERREFQLAEVISQRDEARKENAGLRKRVHQIEGHNQYFFRCESGWCNPTATCNPALDNVKGAMERARVAEADLSTARAHGREEGLREALEFVQRERLDNHEDAMACIAGVLETDISYSNAIRDAENVIISLIRRK